MKGILSDDQAGLNWREDRRESNKLIAIYLIKIMMIRSLFTLIMIVCA